MLWSCDLFTLLYGFDTGGAGAHVKQRQTNDGNIMETAQWRCTAEWCVTSLWNKGERHKRMHICSYTGRVSQARLRLIRAVYVHERLRNISDILWCDVSCLPHVKGCSIEMYCLSWCILKVLWYYVKVKLYPQCNPGCFRQCLWVKPRVKA